MNMSVVLPKAPELRTFFASSELSKLTTTTEGNMSDLLNEKRDELSRQMGWTLQRAQGFVDGETAQQSGQDLPGCHKVEMDEYSKGFRTGYYTHACALSIWNMRETLTVH